MRRSRRRRTSRVFVYSLIGITSLGGLAAYRKFKQSRATAAPPQTSVTAKNIVKATPAAGPAPQAAAAQSQSPEVGVIKQQEWNLKPLLQVSQTPAENTKALPAPVAMRSESASTVRAPSATDTSAAVVVAPAPPPRSEAPADPVVGADRALASAKALFNRGELLAARNTLNDPFVRGTLPESHRVEARELLCAINEQVIFGRKLYAGDIAVAAYTVRSGELLQTIARHHAVTWELLCRVNGMSDPRRLRAGQTLKILRGPFHAVVYKNAFVMDLFLGSPGEPGALFVTSFPVGLGKDDSTPTGKWLVEPAKKIKNPVYYSPRGEGIFDADDPKNPLGEFWIALTGLEGQAIGKLSYGIHGTIEPDSIGKEESMGCIRLRNGDIDRVFEMLMDGKSIVAVKE